MDLLDEFLQHSKKDLSHLEDFHIVRLVMGNCTCDLDSAVCALVQGYLEYLDIKKKMHQLDGIAIIPLMNIPRREYVVKTEVVYSFKVHNISPDLLTFRDEIDLKRLSLAGKILEVVLVDHHVLPEEDIFLTDSVIEVIDHRPRDANWPWHLRHVCIEPVGSCATLVATRFLEAHPEFMNCRIAKILRGAILIDTCNLSKEAQRATPVDIEMTKRLEHLIKHCNLEDCLWEDGDTVYSRLIQARSDISELSIDDLLIKDVKVVDGVPIVVLPILIRKFIGLEPPPKPYDAICNFAEAKNSRLVILLGMLNELNQIKRDFCLFSLSPHRQSLRFKIIDDIRASEIYRRMYVEFGIHQSNLGLTDGAIVFDHKGIWQMMIADQTNLAVTRKKMVKIARDIMKIFPDFKSSNQSRPTFVGDESSCPSSCRRCGGSGIITQKMHPLFPFGNTDIVGDPAYGIDNI